MKILAKVIWLFAGASLVSCGGSGNSPSDLNFESGVRPIQTPLEEIKSPLQVESVTLTFTNGDNMVQTYDLQKKFAGNEGYYLKPEFLDGSPYFTVEVKIKNPNSTNGSEAGINLSIAGLTASRARAIEDYKITTESGHQISAEKTEVLFFEFGKDKSEQEYISSWKNIDAFGKVMITVEVIEFSDDREEMISFESLFLGL
jgi:hypothetical protein